MLCASKGRSCIPINTIGSLVVGVVACVVAGVGGCHPRVLSRDTWSKTNWDKFATTMDEEGLDFSSLHSPQKAERAADNCVRTLHLAIESAVPKINPPSREG